MRYALVHPGRYAHDDADHTGYKVQRDLHRIVEDDHDDYLAILEKPRLAADTEHLDEMDENMFMFVNR